MTPDDDTGRWLPLKEAAAAFGLERDTLRKQLARGERRGRRDNRGRWLILVPGNAGTGPGRAPAPPSTHAGVVTVASGNDAGTVQNEHDRTIEVLQAQVEDLQDERDRLLALVERLTTEQRREQRPWPGLRTWWWRLWSGEAHTKERRRETGQEGA